MSVKRKKDSPMSTSTTTESRDSEVYDFPDEVTKKPKGATTAYGYFSHYHRQEVKDADPSKVAKFAEFSKECAQLWKDMTPKEKERFRVQAASDKERYKEEMKHYVPSEKKTKKKKRAKDPNAPKKTINAFFLFCKDYRSIVREQNPELKVTEITTELSRRWKVLDPKEKIKYTTVAEQDKKRYEKEIAAYKNSLAKAKLISRQQEEEDTSSDDEVDV